MNYSAYSARKFIRGSSQTQVFRVHCVQIHHFLLKIYVSFYCDAYQSLKVSICVMGSGTQIPLTFKPVLCTWYSEDFFHQRGREKHPRTLHSCYTPMTSLPIFTPSLLSSLFPSILPFFSEDSLCYPG